MADARRNSPNRLTKVGYLQSAKRKIIQDLRNEGKTIYSASQQLLNINIFDLNNYSELREASRQLSTSLFMENLSDNPDDIFMYKAKNYLMQYDLAFKVFLLSIDKNDDGKETNTESNEVSFGRIVRR